MGTYIPQLSFLEILLGDEPVLSPQAHFYQRLLALDDDEARDIADKYLKENSLENLYDLVLVPALSLAEQDRHRNVLDETRSKFIRQSARELIEELHETYLNETGAANDESGVIATAISTVSGLRIVCVPAREEADEIVGTMVAQLLRCSGHDAHALPIGPISMMLEQVEQLHADVICVSALSPFATRFPKSLCKQLRHRYPKVTIVLGLWEFPGGVVKAQETVGLSCADMIGTSLAQIVSLMGEANLLPRSTADASGKDPRALEGADGPSLAVA